MRRHEGPFDELARALVVPAQSGIYIAKSEIIVLANLIEGSLRVNERSRMLADVLKSPDNLVDLAKLIARLMELCHAHIQHNNGLIETWPAMAGPLAPSQALAKKTLDRLEDLRLELLDDAEDAGQL